MTLLRRISPASLLCCALGYIALLHQLQPVEAAPLPLPLRLPIPRSASLSWSPAPLRTSQGRHRERSSSGEDQRQKQQTDWRKHSHAPKQTQSQEQQQHHSSSVAPMHHDDDERHDHDHDHHTIDKVVDGNDEKGNSHIASERFMFGITPVKDQHFFSLPIEASSDPERQREKTEEYHDEQDDKQEKEERHHHQRPQADADSQPEDRVFVELAFRSVARYPKSGEEETYMSVPLGKVVTPNDSPSLPLRPTRISIVSAHNVPKDSKSDWAAYADTESVKCWVSFRPVQAAAVVTAPVAAVEASKGDHANEKVDSIGSDSASRSLYPATGSTLRSPGKAGARRGWISLTKADGTLILDDPHHSALYMGGRTVGGVLCE